MDSRIAIDRFVNFDRCVWLNEDGQPLGSRRFDSAMEAFEETRVRLAKEAKENRIQPEFPIGDIRWILG